MALNKSLLFSFVLEKRCKTLNFVNDNASELRNFFFQFGCRNNRAVVRKRSSRRNEQIRVRRENNILVRQRKRFDKALAKFGKIVERSAEKRDFSAYRFAAGKSAYRLIYDRLENRSRNVGFLRTVVKQRLNIALCENAAARRDRVYRFIVFRKFVKSAYVRVEKSRHLIDERARTARAGTVHSLFNAAAQVCYLRVLAAKLDSNVGFGDKRLDSRRSRGNFLNKRDTEPFSRRNTARACYRDGDLGFVYRVKSARKNLRERLFYVGIVPLIFFVYKVVFVVKNCNFYSCRANVKSDMEHILIILSLPCLKSYINMNTVNYTLFFIFFQCLSAIFSPNFHPKR